MKDYYERSQNLCLQQAFIRCLLCTEHLLGTERKSSSERAVVLHAFINSFNSCFLGDRYVSELEYILVVDFDWVPPLKMLRQRFVAKGCPRREKGAPASQRQHSKEGQQVLARFWM